MSTENPPQKEVESSLSLTAGNGSSSLNPLNSTAQMSVEEKFRIIRSIGEECIQEEEELLNLLTKNPQPICYDGFEPSGRMHIAQGVMKTMSVNKLTSAGCKVKIWIADWFAQQNKKMGGDLNKIQDVGRYFIEIWKAAGMNLEDDKVEFLWSSEKINSREHEYWPLVLDIARRNKLISITRCCQNMVRSDLEESTASCCSKNQKKREESTAVRIFYPCMQCADIFFLKADICQLGMDQQEVNVLARGYCDDIKRKNKPIILSHHMLPGLQEGQEKTSKSDSSPFKNKKNKNSKKNKKKSDSSSAVFMEDEEVISSSAVFMDDEEAEVNKKIKKAYCPPNIVDGNPCLEYIKYIVFPLFNEFKVERKEENGGEKVYTSYEKLIGDYAKGELHPADLKPALSKALNRILQPVRDHFKNDEKAKALLKKVKDIDMSTENPPQKEVELSPSLTAGDGFSSLNPLNSTAQMSVEEKIRIVRSIGEECIQEEELLNLLTKNPQPICYDGFEPSGRMHIAQGVMKTMNVNKLTSAGCKVKIWIADWFAQLNNKMGGDLNEIQTVGHYLIEIWKAAGMNLEDDKVKFLWSSDEINSRAHEYWPLVMDIARRNTLTRIKRCCQIMGRRDTEELTVAQIFYPCMQCADIFFLEADICQLGMDQRKVNVLAREYCDDIKRKNKPIILSHHMLPGLKEGQEKMSKSDPSSAVFMEDSEADVNSKIKDAYCPPNIVDGNPCLEYIKYIVFPRFNEFKVERNEENGGEKVYTSFEELIGDYAKGELHPADLKPALSKALNRILQRVRDHFKNDEKAKALLKSVKGFKTTR